MASNSLPGNLSVRVQAEAGFKGRLNDERRRHFGGPVAKRGATRCQHWILKFRRPAPVCWITVEQNLHPPVEQLRKCQQGWTGFEQQRRRTITTDRESQRCAAVDQRARD